LIKKCPRHGEFTGLIEKNPDFYKWFTGLRPEDHSGFSSLMIPVTSRCNLRCKYCYSRRTQDTDLDIDEIIDAVKGFQGDTIELSGGEPTVREDLDSVIARIRSLGKKVTMMTNGVRISDIRYLRRLKSAGLSSVYLSLDSLRSDFYSFMAKDSDGKKLLGQKKQSLKNLESEGITTILSSTVYPGLNDREIRDLFIFSLINKSAISQLRLRNYVKIGADRSGDLHGYLLSDLFELLSEQTRVEKNVLKTLMLKGRMGRSLIFNIRGVKLGDSFVPCVGKDTWNDSNMQTLSVKIVGWPTVDNIDLNEIKTPAAIYLPERHKSYKIFQGMILSEKHL
jgi:MoaA/NifB/PqqE/SkfB family radical SAM enzyme